MKKGLIKFVGLVLLLFSFYLLQDIVFNPSRFIGGIRTGLLSLKDFHIVLGFGLPVLFEQTYGIFLLVSSVGIIFLKNWARLLVVWTEILNVLSDGVG